METSWLFVGLEAKPSEKSEDTDKRRRFEKHWIEMANFQLTLQWGYIWSLQMVIIIQNWLKKG